jgi:hypothetical protein
VLEELREADLPEPNLNLGGAMIVGSQFECDVIVMLFQPQVSADDRRKWWLILKLEVSKDGEERVDW